jgi:hypothetical protein
MTTGSVGFPTFPWKSFLERRLKASMATHEVQFFPADSNCLSFLERSVQEMFRIMDRYIDTRTTQIRWSDRPYNRNERATVSVLAGAIWRSNPENLVLEEVRGEKHSGSSSYLGRGDIWFLADGQQCYGEAKQEWPSVGPGRPCYRASPIGTLGDEVEAAARNKRPEHDFALGIVFSIPDLSKRYLANAHDYMREYQGYLNEGLNAFASEKNCHVLWGKYLRTDLLSEEAYYEPTDNRGVLTRPGVDILIATKKT